MKHSPLGPQSPNPLPPLLCVGLTGAGPRGRVRYGDSVLAVPSVDAELGGIGGCSGGEFLLLLTSPVHTCALKYTSMCMLLGGIFQKASLIVLLYNLDLFK